MALENKIAKICLCTHEEHLPPTHISVNCSNMILVGVLGNIRVRVVRTYPRIVRVNHVILYRTLQYHYVKCLIFYSRESVIQIFDSWQVSDKKERVWGQADGFLTVSNF